MVALLFVFSISCFLLSFFRDGSWTEEGGDDLVEVGSRKGKYCDDLGLSEMD